MLLLYGSVVTFQGCTFSYWWVWHQPVSIENQKAINADHIEVLFEAIIIFFSVALAGVCQECQFSDKLPYQAVCRDGATEISLAKFGPAKFYK